MEIKPIKPVGKITKSELPQTRVDARNPRTPQKIEGPTKGWSISSGTLIVNGREIGATIDELMATNPSQLSSLATQLEAIRQEAFEKAKKKSKRFWKKKTEDIDPTGELGQLDALVEAYLGKIMRSIKRRYEQTTNGINVNLDENGQLNLNGLNVNSFIEMATQNYPSDKAKVFLKGLKNRLGIILNNKQSSLNYDKIREVTLKAMEEIDRLLEEEV